MGIWWRWVARLRDLVQRRKQDEQTVDEIEFHLEMETRELIQAGMSPDAARREARIRFGGEDRFREEVAQQRFAARFDDVARDTRGAVRGLIHSPGFATTAILTLALGIGANAAIFSAVHSILLRPLPYAESDAVYQIQTEYSGSFGAISPAEYLDYRDRLTDVVEAVGVYSLGSLTLTGDGDPEILRTAYVNAGFFPALGVSPELGRAYTAEEEDDGVRLILISNTLWRTRFGEDPNILGRTVTLNGIDRQIIGVLPESAHLPEDLLTGQAAHVFSPQGITPDQVENRGSHYLFGVARVQAGVSRVAVTDAFESLGQWMVETYPDGYPDGMDFRVTVAPLASAIRGPIRTPLVVMISAVLFVLLIACANVANLLLARADRRRREFSLRSALGASRGRLARQATVESLVLGLAGGVAGLVLAGVILRVVVARATSDLPWLEGLGLHVPVMGFALGLSLLCALGIGIAPAIQASSGNPSDALSDQSRGASVGRSGRRLRRALIVGQLAVSLVLLTAGGLMVDSFARLLRVDPGFRTTEVLTTNVSLPSASYGDAEARIRFFQQLTDRFEQIPGVTRSAAVTNLPLATRLGDLNFEIEGRPVPEGTVSPRADWQVVTPGYFDAMDI